MENDVPAQDKMREALQMAELANEIAPLLGTELESLVRLHGDMQEYVHYVFSTFGVNTRRAARVGGNGDT